jgi:hypothetical protein
MIRREGDRMIVSGALTLASVTAALRTTIARLYGVADLLPAAPASVHH